MKHAFENPDTATSVDKVDAAKWNADHLPSLGDVFLLGMVKGLYNASWNELADAVQFGAVETSQTGDGTYISGAFTLPTLPAGCQLQTEVIATVTPLPTDRRVLAGSTSPGGWWVTTNNGSSDLEIPDGAAVTVLVIAVVVPV